MEKLRKIKCSFREMTIINSSQGLKNNQETLRFIVYLSYNFLLNLAFSCLALLNFFSSYYTLAAFFGNSFVTSSNRIVQQKRFKFVKNCQKVCPNEGWGTANIVRLKLNSSFFRSSYIYIYICKMAFSILPHQWLSLTYW